MTIEDETGCANLVIFKSLFEKFRREILYSKLNMAEGKLQIEGDVTHVVVERLYDISPYLEDLVSDSSDLRLLTLARADENDAKVSEVLKSGRNFR